MKYFMLYGKAPGAKRFSPMDYNRGACVTNLIHATMFREEERGKVGSAEALEEINEGWRFDWRQCS